MNDELTLSDISRGLGRWYDIQALRTRYLGPKHEDPRQLMDLHFSGWYLAMMAVSLNVFCTVGYINNHQILPEFTAWLSAERLDWDGTMNAFMLVALANVFIAVFCAAINSDGISTEHGAAKTYEKYCDAYRKLVTGQSYASPPKNPKGTGHVYGKFRTNPAKLYMDLAGKTTVDVINELNRTCDYDLDPSDFVLHSFDDTRFFPGTVVPIVLVPTAYSTRVEGVMMISVQIPHSGAAGMMPRFDDRAHKRYISMLTGGSFNPQRASAAGSAGNTRYPTESPLINPHVVKPSEVGIDRARRQVIVEYDETPMGTRSNAAATITRLW